MGQKYLASGVQVSMRLWENTPPGEPKRATARDYETVGYVIAGRAELRIEAFTAVEATSPPAQVHGRDER
jgi:hypothetical protein